MTQIIWLSFVILVIVPTILAGTCEIPEDILKPAKDKCFGNNDRRWYIHSDDFNINLNVESLEYRAVYNEVRLHIHIPKIKMAAKYTPTDKNERYTRIARSLNSYIPQMLSLRTGQIWAPKDLDGFHRLCALTADLKWEIKMLLPVKREECSKALVEAKDNLPSIIVTDSTPLAERIAKIPSLDDLD